MRSIESNLEIFFLVCVLFWNSDNRVMVSFRVTFRVRYGVRFRVKFRVRYGLGLGKKVHACADRRLSFVTNVTFVFLNIIHKLVNLRTQFKPDVVV